MVKEFYHKNLIHFATSKNKNLDLSMRAHSKICTVVVYFYFFGDDLMIYNIHLPSSLTRYIAYDYLTQTKSKQHLLKLNDESCSDSKSFCSHNLCAVDNLGASRFDR